VPGDFVDHAAATAQGWAHAQMDYGRLRPLTAEAQRQWR
jgi:hypothetical protein